MGDLLKGISAIAWPALAIYAFVRLYPVLKEAIRSRGFAIKVAGMEISVEKAAELQRKQLSDLQDQVLKLKEGVPSLSAHDQTPARLVDLPRATPRFRSVLWVDDNPTNNVYTVAKLREAGVNVDQVTSSAEAIQHLAYGTFDAIISDVEREEEGPDAGLHFLDQLKAYGSHIPVFMFCSPASIQRKGAEAIQKGACGATASPVELLGMLESPPKNTHKDTERTGSFLPKPRAASSGPKDPP